MIRQLIFFAALLSVCGFVQAQQGSQRNALRFSLEYGSANPSDRMVDSEPFWGVAASYRFYPRWRLELGADFADFSKMPSNTRTDLERTFIRLAAVYRAAPFLSLAASAGSGDYEERRHNSNNCPDPNGPNCFDPKPIDESGLALGLGLYGHLFPRWSIFLRYQRIDLTEGFLTQSSDYEETSFGLRFSFP